MAMSYNEYLRKNPTDYKARAMGRKRWEATQGAKQKMKVGSNLSLEIYRGHYIFIRKRGEKIFKSQLMNKNS